GIWPVVAVAAALASRAGAAEPRADIGDRPVKLTLQPEDQSVYALPAPPTQEEGGNAGGVNGEVRITYLTDYIYRGVNRTDFINSQSSSESSGNANFQFDGQLKFNLGKLPHPFIGIFANVLDQDPISTFQEVRPFFGAEWRIRPFILVGGNDT